MSMRITRQVIQWLPLALAITGVCGLIYIAVHQNYRQSLNDPQVQLAEDAAFLLDQNQPLADRPNVDIAESLSPWIAVYDKNGDVTDSSGYLHNEPAQPPKGVFDAARLSGEDRVTWQPEPTVRQAIIVVPLKSGGYVVSGRNMREVESREAMLEIQIGAAWGVIMLASLFLSLFFAVIKI